MLKVSEILQPIQIERERRLEGLKKEDSLALELWNFIIGNFNKYDKNKIEETFSFAKSINYKHPNISSEIYFAHPIRVASYATLFSKYKNIDYPILGLIHNIFELSNIDKSEMTSLFGYKIVKEIEVLTVDRDFQWDHEYKKKYYERINAHSHTCRLVKVLDKLDNLYLLHLNPDHDIKIKYLLEIETHIKPIIKNDIPILMTYFNELLENCKSLSLK